MSKLKRNINVGEKGKKPFYKKKWFIVICVLLLISIGSSTGSEETSDESTKKENKPSEKIEVKLDVTVDNNGEKPIFTINTNLPDKAELMLTLTNDDRKYIAQSKVLVKAGTAKSEAFSAKGNKLSGEYLLSVSMGIPTTQDESVQKIIGENGENLTGPIVQKATVTDDYVVSKDFKFTFKSDLKNETSSKKPPKNEKDDIKQYIEKCVDNYDGSKINKIVLNENIGSDEEGDYVALVYLTWDVKNSSQTTQTMLTMYSEDMAANIGVDKLKVTDMAIFWEIPYLNGNAKLSFERKGESMFYSDKVFAW